MKANNKESQAFSDAIDSVNSGMETIINFYNELEEDEPLIKFDDAVVDDIMKAKEKYGDDFVDNKINSLVKEMLSWLPLDQGDQAEEEKNEG
ncbi:MAG: atypical membrane-integrating protein (Mistic protein) [Tuberibacillus sp.]